MLLIDEIDRADEEFEAFLLEVLSDFQITIPEIGTISAADHKPAVVLTSNRTRELHDALKRRCLYHWIGHPALEREVAIVKLRVPGVPERLAAQAAAFVQGLRGLDLAKPPGVAETIDWANALTALGRQELDAEVVEQTLGSVLKYHEDVLAVRDETLQGLLDEARAATHLMADAVARHVVTFGRVLREAGLEVGPGRLADALTGLDLVDLARRDDVYWTLRQTLVSRWEDLEAFDAAFRAWFLRAPTAPVFRQGTEVTSLRLLRRSAERKRAEEEGGESGEDQTSLGYSPDELLRRRDFADMTSEEMENVSKLICAIASGRPRRKSRRLRPHHRGRDLDMRRLVRESLGTGGDAIERTFRSRVQVPRKLVVLCDVSGSMEAYARALVLFLHALARSGRGVETFAFGTRLTRLTRELIIRDPEGALQAASERVVDWSGGTRIGHSLKAFNDEWGRRALTRGAVVVIVSDGWEREDAAVVGHEMARLARQAYAVVWVNPLKGHPDYQPLAGGMRAALPHVDRFLSGHNLASLEELADVLTGIERRHAA